MRDLIDIANRIRSDKYPGSEVLFLAGSVVRGAATASSDLDLVVLYQELPAAYRESFEFQGWPVEAFVHDPETLRYFFFELDRPSGVPALPSMVSEGLEIPGPCELSTELKEIANQLLAEGPPAWDSESVNQSRYRITDLIDDLRTPRSDSELVATATELYRALANHYLRTRGVWSAKGKTIPRRLQEVAPQFAHEFNAAFDDVFTAKRTDLLICLAESVLERDGGWLFAGHSLKAPHDWRTSNSEGARRQEP